MSGETSSSDRIESSAHRSSNKELKNVAHRGPKAVSQAYMQRALQRHSAINNEPVILSAGGIASNRKSKCAAIR